MFPLNIDSFVSGYKDAMDFLANTTSRNIVIHVEPLKSGCQNHSGFDFVSKRAFNVYNSGNPFSTTTPTVITSLGISGILNIPFSGGLECPVCQGEGFINSPSTGVVNARIQYRNQLTEYSLDEVKLKDHDFKVRIKVTGSYAISLLDRAVRVDVDNNPCKIIEEKVPVGLRDIHTYYYYLDDLQ